MAISKSGKHTRSAPAPRPPKPAAPEAFCFEMNPKRLKFSDEFILRQLRTFARKVRNRPFTNREFDRWKQRGCAAGSIGRRFGSWPRALAAIGIRGGAVREYDPRHLIEHLEKVWLTMGRPPGTLTLRNHGRISAGPYRRHWGSLRRACTLFSRYKDGQITLDDLLRAGPRRAIRSSLRWDVLNRDGHRCKSCGHSPQHHNVTLEIDHIVPVAAGGSDDPSNLQTLCIHCNRGKRDKPRAAPQELK